MFIKGVLGQYRDMNHFLIDIGNTRIKSMVFDGVAGKGIPLEEAYTAIVHGGDFYSAVNECFEGLFSDGFLGASACTVLVSNVAGDLARQALDEFFVNHTSCELVYAEVERQQFGIKNGYQRLRELGVDRWLAVIGARQLFSDGAVIVINCGTAITVDYLNSDNEFVGGAILPGFDLSFSALSRADGIARFNISNDVFVLGDTTQDCVRLGVLSACVGGVERIVSNIDEAEVAEISVVISGGAAEVFIAMSSLKGVHDANLVFRGLSQVVS